MLHKIHISTPKHQEIPLSYQLFGQPLHTAPIVLINHALTGNSQVAGERGWWNEIVEKGKAIDLNTYTVLVFNIPGNGYDDFFIDNFKDFTLKDIAQIFIEGLKQLEIQKLYALVGASIGGSIAWEMLGMLPDIAHKFIPIATDYKTTDWLHSQSVVQEFLFTDVGNPLYKTRIQAMLNYRTPESLNQRFNREQDAEKGILKSYDWLNYHGKLLSERFSIKVYRLMNHLMTTIDIPEEELQKIKTEIHLIAVDTDLYYPAFEIKKTYDFLKKQQCNVHYHEIKSIHGHDAFLMEYPQLNEILKPLF